MFMHILSRDLNDFLDRISMPVTISVGCIVVQRAYCRIMNMTFVYYIAGTLVRCCSQYILKSPVRVNFLPWHRLRYYNIRD